MEGQLFPLAGFSVSAKTRSSRSICPSVSALCFSKAVKESAALDAGLLSGAQAVEHYEISRYGTLIAWAEQLGIREAIPLLKQTLQEEKKTDEALTRLAESALNRQAA